MRESKNSRTSSIKKKEKRKLILGYPSFRTKSDRENRSGINYFVAKKKKMNKYV